jgi:hypothetical protein
MDKLNSLFIIAHKYMRGYESYIEYYIQNIKNFYNDALIIVVDNNSTDKNDIFDKLKKYSNVILLENNIESKFEIGAYTVGLKYIIENDLSNKYSYIFLTQDNYVIKNKVDLNKLLEKNVLSCPLLGLENNSVHYNNIIGEVYLYENDLTPLGLYDNMDKISFCWCSCFLIHNSKINQLHSYLSKIKIQNRTESCRGERYLGRIIYELNEHQQNYSIDGDIYSIRYDCHSVNIIDNSDYHFVKRSQAKTKT